MENVMIPPKIHYVWLGGNEKPESVLRCINSWKKYMPDYEIVEWSEENFNVNESCDYVKEAYEHKKWAFVSDYIRLYALWKEGGIYFDTDLEVVRSFEPFMRSGGFMCNENTFSVCTAVIGSPQNAEWIKEILDKYDQRKFIVDGKEDMMPNTRYIFDFLKDKYQYKYCDDTQVLPSGLVIYSKDYFSPMNSATGILTTTNNTYAIHHYDNSWISSTGKIKRRLRMWLTRVIGEENKEKLRKIIKR